jgi:Na+/H+ antiporter NhaD/arsenite permease-like protein
MMNYKKSFYLYFVVLLLNNLNFISSYYEIMFLAIGSMLYFFAILFYLYQDSKSYCNIIDDNTFGVNYEKVIRARKLFTFKMVITFASLILLLSYPLFLILNNYYDNNLFQKIMFYNNIFIDNRSLDKL